MKKLLTICVLMSAIVAMGITLEAKTTKKARKGKSRTSQTTKKTTSYSNLNGHQAVDLGLSVKWATCNLGAYSPEDKGSYFLGSQNDRAHQEWGGGWRLPNIFEVQELLNLCYWTWTGNGYRITGRNGNSIFLPSTGRKFQNPYSNELYYSKEGFYWTGTLCDGLKKAYTLNFENGKKGINSHEFSLYAMPIRAVIK